MMQVDTELNKRLFEAALNQPTNDLPQYLHGDEFLRSIKPADWIYRGLLIRSYLYTLTSPTNHGKTTVMATLIAKAIAGQDFGRFKNASGRQLKVLLLCGENDQDTGVKLMAAFQAFDVTEATVKENLIVLPASFSMVENAEAMSDSANEFGVEFDLAVIDTWQAYWGGGEFNGNGDALNHAKALRSFAKRLRGSPVCIVPAHPVKGASKDNLVPYGGGAALNEIDCNLTGWKDGDVFTLHHSKLRQQPFEPAAFQLEGVTLPKLPDIDGIATCSVIAKPISDAVAEAAQIKNLGIRDAVLLAISDAGQNRGKTSRRAIKEELIRRGIDVTEAKVRKAIEDLRNSGYLEPDPTVNALTKKGKQEVKNAR